MDNLQAKLAEKRNNQFLQDLRAVLSTPEGRGVFCWLLDACRVNELSFTGNSQTFMYEGMRKVGLELLRFTMALPDGLDLKQLAEQEYKRRGNGYLQNIRDELKGE